MGRRPSAMTGMLACLGNHEHNAATATYLLRMVSSAAARSPAGTSRWYSSGCSPAHARLAATSAATPTLAANTSVRPVSLSSSFKIASCRPINRLKHGCTSHRTGLRPVLHAHPACWHAASRNTASRQSAFAEGQSRAGLEAEGEQYLQRLLPAVLLDGQPGVADARLRLVQRLAREPG